MRLLACPDCHRQFDVTHVQERVVPCPCGARVENRVQAPVEAPVRRCGSCGAAVDSEAERCAYCRAPIVRDLGPLSLICPECYARNDEGARFCTACGIAFDPQPLADEADEVRCPCCQCRMSPRGVGDVAAQECPRCHGLWVPGDHFHRLVERAIEAAGHTGTRKSRSVQPRRSGGNPVDRPVQYRRCPVCAAFMQRRNYHRTSGVVIDRCRQHGTWLDADELEQIAGFILEAGGLPPEPRREVRRIEPDAYGLLGPVEESVGGGIVRLLTKLLT